MNSYVFVDGQRQRTRSESSTHYSDPEDEQTTGTHALSKGSNGRRLVRGVTGRRGADYADGDDDDMESDSDAEEEEEEEEEGDETEESEVCVVYRRLLRLLLVLCQIRHVSKQT